MFMKSGKLFQVNTNSKSFLFFRTFHSVKTHTFYLTIINIRSYRQWHTLLAVSNVSTTAVIIPDAYRSNALEMNNETNAYDNYRYANQYPLNGDDAEFPTYLRDKKRIVNSERITRA